ncbi:MAG: IclR family transcriptional regulator [Eubacteriales bacterium]|jgi:IclR family KDG regulon transcriptional repressor|nr:IclR family transcriptional regulator [Eubacteriales bacterium]MDD3289494.1 IclR family transcriptional regulator [Eubacteriales bacterium]MDD3863456.1 IclR family transcriptional regulator [Eubacteriales bacterium]MDD4444689.1 IclR family transcriptional regulator [Eubacteriales bacterium]
MQKNNFIHTGDKIGSIDKALTLLEVLATEPYAFAIAEIVSKTGFNRTTIYRTLQILLNREYVHYDKERDKYQIGHATYHAGTIYLHNNSYQDKVMEILVEISELTKESVGMAVREGDKIMSLLEVEIHQPMKFNDFPGKYFPPNKGSYGKCIMAYQSEKTIDRILDGQVFEKTCYNTLTTKEELKNEYAKIREQGYVTSIDELYVDVVGTGIPIFDRNGQVNAVVAVAFFREEGWTEKLERFTKLLLSYQNKIEKCMP